MSRWWRAYDEAVDDPKLIMLSDRAHRAWFNLCCLASAHNGKLPDIKVIAIKLRMSPAKAAALITELVQAGLIDEDETGFRPHNWDGRQYKSDVSTERVKRFRQRERNVSETPPETEAETDTKTEKKKVESALARATRLQTDWVPSNDDLVFAQRHGLNFDAANTEALKFRNYWTSKSGKDATKLNWPRTWQNWILNARKPNGASNGSRQTPATLADRAAELAGQIRDRERAAGVGRADDPLGSGAAGQQSFEGLSERRRECG